MREILFRGKRIKDGMWIYGYPLVDDADCSAKAEGKCCCLHDGSNAYINRWIDDFHEYESEEVFRETIGQYTGLTDKNGVKIFEGDILRNNGGEKFVVVYSGKWVRFVAQETENGLTYEWSMWDANKVAEVIGNIHDNPEMLKLNT